MLGAVSLVVDGVVGRRGGLLHGAVSWVVGKRRLGQGAASWVVGGVVRKRGLVQGAASWAVDGVVRKRWLVLGAVHWVVGKCGVVGRRELLQGAIS